jgi:hypothetical protein
MWGGLAGGDELQCCRSSIAGRWPAQPWPLIRLPVRSLEPRGATIRRVPTPDAWQHNANTVSIPLAA